MVPVSQARPAFQAMNLRQWEDLQLECRLLALPELPQDTVVLQQLLGLTLQTSRTRLIQELTQIVMVPGQAFQATEHQQREDLQLECRLLALAELLQGTKIPIAPRALTPVSTLRHGLPEPVAVKGTTSVVMPVLWAGPARLELVPTELRNTMVATNPPLPQRQVLLVMDLQVLPFQVQARQVRHIRVLLRKAITTSQETAI